MNNKPIFQASQIGETEAMYLAATRGFSLKDVGIKETAKNIADFDELKSQVKEILENGAGLASL